MFNNAQNSVTYSLGFLYWISFHYFCLTFLPVAAVSNNEDTTSASSLHTEPWNRESNMPRLHETLPGRKDEEEDNSKEEELQDCTSARLAAMEIHRQAPDAGTYVPECSASGDYTRAQCHRSPPTCWCVHPRTGRPIRGTATQGVKPDCEAAKSRTKNFKGCSVHKKQEFLDELIKSFTKEMQEDALNKSINLDTPTPEKAARWKFADTDSNSNGILDKREWKIFKTEWRSLQDSRLKRRLRKCWRNLPRFCDENANQKITMDEWLACTVTTRDSKNNFPRNNNRKGKNPLVSILKGDWWELINMNTDLVHPALVPKLVPELFSCNWKTLSLHKKVQQVVLRQTALWWKTSHVQCIDIKYSKTREK